MNNRFLFYFCLFVYFSVTMSHTIFAESGNPTHKAYMTTAVFMFPICVPSCYLVNLAIQFLYPHDSSTFVDLSRTRNPRLFNVRSLPYRGEFYFWYRSSVAHGTHQKFIFISCNFHCLALLVIWLHLPIF